METRDTQSERCAAVFPALAGHIKAKLESQEQECAVVLLHVRICGAEAVLRAVEPVPKACEREVHDA